MKRGAAWMLAVWCVAQTAGAADPRTREVPAATPWPALTQTAKPWTRWWWPGSAVTRDGITNQLEQFAAAGIGGVEITPIYGARGSESQYIDYLSPRWVEMLEHTTREARRLGLGVDMATGTGWPFGGPRVAPEDGSRSLTLIDGRLAGNPTGMKVKRPAPGGEGLVLDPYSTQALDRYLAPFGKALSTLPRGAVRSQFHDSFEYFNASTTPGLLAAFRSLNGYDLEKYAAELMGEKPLDADSLGRIKGDYRRTLAKLHLDYLQRWVAWAHAHGFQARNQAHGAPANLLDLYTAADIPETESFGAIRFPVIGLRQKAGEINEDPDPPIALIARFASSAAHVTGKPLVSSETLTWLRDNFRETPAAAKLQIDRLFIAGINHVIYHGSTYSPAEAAWPGWFFYAATQMNPTNPLWRDFAALHAYVARVQSVLQQGDPNNQILLYWPQADLDDDPAGLMRQYGMHENAWSKDSNAGRLALRLLEAGYSFDFVSDAQLSRFKAIDTHIESENSIYRVLVVPRTRRMPLESLEALHGLAASGARVVFEAPPEDVSGYGNLAERRMQFAQLRAALFRDPARSSADLVRDLESLGPVREPMAEQGLWFVRRVIDGDLCYFIVNPTARPVSGWIPIGARARYALLLDPLSGDAGLTAIRDSANAKTSEVHLQLESGQSMLLRAAYFPPTQTKWRTLVAAGEPRALDGPWRVKFLDAGPALRKVRTVTALASWTGWSPEAQRFSGTVRYRHEFSVSPESADDWLLDLGDVRETARVTLNGSLLGTTWALPARLRVGEALRRGRNLLEIEVTNLPANRVRDLDLRKVDWKIMKDINLASLKYSALDAATWEPLDSGLLGPVRLVPMKLVRPDRSPNAP
jgi:alpha-L-rhamnosidase